MQYDCVFWNSGNVQLLQQQLLSTTVLTTRIENVACNCTRTDLT